MIIASELVNLLIPPLKPSDKLGKVLTWMDELRVNQLPVVDHEVFQGFVLSDEVMDMNDAKAAVSEVQLHGVNCSINESQHFFDVMKTASDFEMEMVAVLNDVNLYQGSIGIGDTMNAFAQTTSVQNPGAILVLSLNQIDYSLSEISRLVESDDIKILSSHTSVDVMDPSKLKLTLKLNETEVSRVMATLERFNYRIVSQFKDTTTVDNNQERLDILMKYLDL
ncbi:MAG: cbs domain containing protein [Bacteroidota bacterium]